MRGAQATMWAKRGEIAQILAEEDVMGLAPGNPDIVEEYRLEADAIARELTGSETRETIASVVGRVFKHYFEIDMSSEDADRVAGRIAKTVS